MTKKHTVQMSPDIAVEPSKDELKVAKLLMKYFQTDVIFVDRRPNAKTPDIMINGVQWEIKTPRGEGRRTIANLLRKASKQSANVIVDLRRVKMNQEQAISKTKFALLGMRSIKKALIIKKNDEIIDLC